MKKCLWFSILLVGFWLMTLCSCATTPTPKTVPLPTDKIVAPDPNLPPELSAFLGKWSGRWFMTHHVDSNMAATLTVEKIDHKRAVIFYTWKGNYDWNLAPGQTPRFAVKLFKKDGITYFSWESKGNQFIFHINKDGELEGLMGKGKHHETYIKMDKE